MIVSIVRSRAAGAADSLLIDLDKIDSRTVYSQIEAINTDILYQSFRTESLEVLSAPLLCNLLGSVEHWKTGQADTRLYYLLVNWIEGINPPPRCRALINNTFCIEIALSSEVHFCNLLHKCNSRNQYPACQNQRLGGDNDVKFCRRHACSSESCKLERLPEVAFCETHVCVGCLERCLQRADGRVKIRVPSTFACEEHKCFGFRRPGDNNNAECNRLQVFPHKYCSQHMCVECALHGDIFDEPRVDRTSFLCKFHSCVVPHCMNSKIDDSGYCKFHICYLCSSDGLVSGVDLKCPEAQLCAEHRCTHIHGSNDPKSLCSRPKLVGKSLFCTNHSCKGCVALGLFADSPCVDNSPRNACDKHPLCTYISQRGKLCDAVALPGEDCCEPHKKLITGDSARTIVACSGTTKRGGKACKSQATIPKGKGKMFCADHCNQGEATDSDTSDTDDDDDDDGAGLIAASFKGIGNDNIQEGLGRAVSHMLLAELSKLKNTQKQLLRCSHGEGGGGGGGCYVEAMCSVSLHSWRCRLHSPSPFPSSSLSSTMPISLAGSTSASQVCSTQPIITTTG